MDPGRGRLRGFRAPDADPAGPDPTGADPAGPDPADAAPQVGPAWAAAASAPAPVGGESGGSAVRDAQVSGEVLTIGKTPTGRATRGPRRSETIGAPGQTDPTAAAPSRTVEPRTGPRAPGWRWAIAAAGVLVVAMVVIATLAFRLGSSTSTPSSQQSTPAASTPSAATPLPVTAVYQNVAPSVVMITTSKGSLGSGVVVNNQGLVLTAHHVVADGGSISLLFADGTKASAQVASSNPKSDIATLTPAKLPEVVVPAVLGGGIAVGSDVVAIGNPLGLRDSTTTGVVSGLDRTTKTASGSVSGLIQFDAAVNPGSSGGPLLDEQGLVVGVVVSIADPGHDDAFAGIGFAVPIGTALGGGDGDAGPGGGPRL